MAFQGLGKVLSLWKPLLFYLLTLKHALTPGTWGFPENYGIYRKYSHDNLVHYSHRIKPFSGASKNSFYKLTNFKLKSDYNL